MADNLEDRCRDFKGFFEESPTANYITQKDGKIIEINFGFTNLLGYSLEDAKRLNAKDVYAHPEDRHYFQELIQRKGAVNNYPVTLYHKGGHTLDCLLTSHLRRDQNGNVNGYRGMITQDRVLHDYLTHTWNRRGFYQLVPRRMSMANREGKSGVLLCVDIDNMKEINDNYGHETGDRALKTVADAMNNSVRKADVVARIGGDEFAVFAMESQHELDPEKLVERITSKLKDTSQGYQLSVSVGASVYEPNNPDDVKYLDGMMKEADSQMFEQKRSKIRNNSF